jgi:hypothetical protein
MPQAGRNWNGTTTIWLSEQGFTRLRKDLCIFVLFEAGVLVAIIALYVDDIILGADSIARKDWFLLSITSRFKSKITGTPANVLGLSLRWEAMEGFLYFKSVKLVNIKSVKILIKRFDLENTKPVSLPFNSAARLSKDQQPIGEQLNCSDLKIMQSNYRTIVGTLIWLQGTTRIDIMPILLILTQFSHNPAYEHYSAALWVIRYLKGTINYGIEYNLEKPNILEGYVDADHASHESRYSIYCYIFTYAGGPIFWKNGFEQRFSLSTAESEIRAVYALRECIKHIMYMKKLFISLGEIALTDGATIAMSHLPLKIFEDNAAAIRYGINPSSQSTMKYFEIDILWINDAINRGEFELVKIETQDQLADLGTKFTTSDLLFKHRATLMVKVTFEQHIS